MKTLRDKFTLALMRWGEKEVRRSARWIVFTRNAGGFFYIGKHGSLRFGPTAKDSVPVNDTFKQTLLAIVESEA